MIFLKLFIIFTKIGTFNFGGGYAMLSLIHNEVVVKNAWLTNSEFTKVVSGYRQRKMKRKLWTIIPFAIS